MPNFCRATFFFEDGKYSWTETHYIVGNYANLDQPLVIARALADKRTMMLPSYRGDLGPGGGPEMTEVRVSYDDVWRDSLVDPNVKRGSKGSKYNKALLGETRAHPEMPYSTALVRLNAGDKYRRSMYLSGVPKDVIDDPNGPNEEGNAAWLEAYQAYRKMLAAADTNWGFKVALKTGDGVTEKAIVETAFNGGTWTFTIPGHGFPLTNPDGSAPTVIIRNVLLSPKQPTYAGRNLYATIDANHIKVHPPKDTGNSFVEKAGIARPLVYAVKAYSSCDLVGETHRKRGVRSGRPLGRSRNRS